MYMHGCDVVCDNNIMSELYWHWQRYVSHTSELAVL